MGQDSQVAVFIDYDNIEMSVSDVLGKNTDVDWNRALQTAAQMGRVVLRRAYADWAEAIKAQRQLLSLGVELIHVNSKRGKNAADIRIVIDTLELLYSKQNEFTHVLLVSGDGDFTELIHRLRTNGKVVYGMGVSGTSAEYLVNACDKFIYYDKLPGIENLKKNNQNNQRTNQKQNGASVSARSRSSQAAATDGKLEQYLNILAEHKVRMVPTTHRPLIIYKIFDIVKANPEFTFNELKQFAEVFFSNATPKIDSQLILDTAHQLFHTFCFEFDPDSQERIWDRHLFFSPGIENAPDLLDKCDGKLLQYIISDLGSPDKLDKEIAATILYGGIRNPKVLDHVMELIHSG